MCRVSSGCTGVLSGCTCSPVGHFILFKGDSSGTYKEEMDLLIANREIIRSKWSEISDKHISVPKTLFDHQADTVSLLLSKENVLCAQPTGGGKTLAQLGKP